MSAPLLTLAVDQNDSLDRIITLNDGATPPNPIDLTGCSARMMIRANYNAQVSLITLTSTNGGGIILGGTAGTIEIQLTPAQTLSLAVNPKPSYNVANGPPTETYVADLNVTYPSMSSVRIANFLIVVTATVTKP